VITVLGKHRQLTEAHATGMVEAEECWGDPATGGRIAQRRAKRIPRRQLLTGCIPGEAKASTAQGDPK
jgi:hypothetical protein